MNCPLLEARLYCSGHESECTVSRDLIENMEALDGRGINHDFLYIYPTVV